MIGNEIRLAGRYERYADDRTNFLIAHARRKAHDPVFYPEVAPQSEELEGRIKNNIRRGDVRNYFARNVLRFVGGRK